LGNNGATDDNRDGQTAYLAAENLGVKVTILADTGSDYSAIPRSAVKDAKKCGFPLKVTVLADTGSDYSAIPRSAVKDAKKCGFPLKVEVSPESIMLNMAIRGESDKQMCSSKEMLMSAVTITTLSGPLCMRGVRQIIVKEDMYDQLIGRPVFNEMGFMASEHLDSVRDKLHLHDFSHFGEELLNMGKQPLGALSKLLLKPAGIPEFLEDLPDVLTQAMKQKHESSGGSEAERA
jgi:hypothetical protein